MFIEVNFRNCGVMKMHTFISDPHICWLSLPGMLSLCLANSCLSIADSVPTWILFQQGTKGCSLPGLPASQCCKASLGLCYLCFSFLEGELLFRSCVSHYSRNPEGLQYSRGSTNIFWRRVRSHELIIISSAANNAQFWEIGLIFPDFSFLQFKMNRHVRGLFRSM